MASQQNHDSADSTEGEEMTRGIGSSESLSGGEDYEPGLFDLVWKWLNSLTAAIWVLVLIACLSILGTIIPQWNQVPDVSEAAYIARFGEFRWSLIEFFGLHHIYSTWYFIALNVWLAVSAAVCTIKKLRYAVRALRDPIVIRSPDYYRSGKVRHSSDALDADKVEQRLRQAHFRVLKAKAADGSVHFFGQRGHIRLWSIVALHLSILIILIGVAVSYVYGFQGSVAVEPGSTVAVQLDPSEGKPVWLRRFLSTHAKPRTFYFTLHSFSIPLEVLKTESPGAPASAGHGRLREFERLVVRQYTSDLSVRVGEAEERKRDLSVNWPMRTSGISIYQNAYRYIIPLHIYYEGREIPSDPVTTGSVLSVSAKGAFDQRTYPHGRYVVEVLDFKKGEVYDGRELVEIMPPTALVRIVEPATGVSALQLADPANPVEVPDMALRMGPADEVISVSIFTYKDDTGIDIVYFGTLLLSLAVIFALWVGYDRVRVRVKGNSSDWRFVRQGLQVRLAEVLSELVDGRVSVDEPR